MPDSGLGRSQERMGITRTVRLLWHLIDHAPDPARGEICPLAEAHHAMRLAARHGGDQMAELPRHVLVDEQQVHGAPAAIETRNTARSAELDFRHMHAMI